jgi:hypothetical protein
VGESALKRREGSGYRPAPAPRPFRHLRGAHPQERHQIRRAAERVGDRRAALERERSLEATGDLGDQHRPGGGPGAVELGQSPKAVGIVLGGDAECETNRNVDT